jgi:hypothetical protein
MFLPAPALVTAKTRLASAGSIRMSITFPAPVPKSPLSFWFQFWPLLVVVHT